MSEPFAKVYKSVGRCRKLTLSAKALAIEIMLLRVENGYENEFPIVRRRTEATLGFGHSQLERAIRNLMKHGFIVEVSRGLYRATSLLLEGVEGEPGLHNPGEGDGYILCKGEDGQNKRSNVDFQEVKRFLIDKCPALSSQDHFVGNLKKLLSAPKYATISTVDVFDSLRTANRAFSLPDKHEDRPRKGIVAYLTGAFNNKISQFQQTQRSQNVSTQPGNDPQVRTAVTPTQNLDPHLVGVINDLNAGETISPSALPNSTRERLVTMGAVQYRDQLLVRAEGYRFYNHEGHVMGAPKEYLDSKGLVIP